jgi:membrane complex biogenesis BtpA family protein
MESWPSFIGMIHLLPLPGSPKFSGSFQAVVDAALRDANALEDGGVHGIMMENFGDTPFFPGSVPVHVATAMTTIANQIRQASKLPLGINVLRNDALTAMSIAAAVGASFVRVNILTGARVTDQGIIAGCAHDLLRLRAALKCDVRILADIDVKHSAPLAPFSIKDEVEDVVKRGMADAVIASGSGTGKPVDLQKLHEIRAAADAPLLLGSGVNHSNLREFAKLADGFIVGTSLKRTADIHSPVDVSKVRRFREVLDAVSRAV